MAHAKRKRRIRVSRKLVLILLFLSALLVGVVSVAEAHPIHYVTVAGAGSGNGSSWDNAHAGVQAALTAAESGDEIWVAEGTYKPSVPAGRDATFQLKNGVALYGGFAGTEDSREERNWTDHETILSGDIGKPGDTSDNSYHVVRGCDAAVLDGFTITRGNADGIADGNNLERMFGGGMANFGASPAVRHCTFFDNAADSGGGMVNFGGNPTVTDCVFDGNTASLYGGGMWNRMSSPTVTHCTFSSNWADEEGGGMCNEAGGTPKVTDCTFFDNAALAGGGMGNYMSSPTVTRCDFLGNEAFCGGGMTNDAGSDPIVAGCLFDSNVAGEPVTMGNIETRLSDGIGTDDRNPVAPRSRANDAAVLEVCSGGGMYNLDSSPTVTECSFESNVAVSFPVLGLGGGMCNVASSPVVDDCSFDENFAFYGGGMSNGADSDPAVTDCTFSGNVALFGGGMSNDESSPTIAGCTFADNGAALCGGGMDNYLYSSPQVTHCSFRGNWAWYGGGMDNEAGSNPTVADCLFDGNVAEEAIMARLPDGIGTDARDHVAPRSRADKAGESRGYGGGMANLHSNPTVTNCTFSGNSTDYKGGGMGNDCSSPTVTNCTFSSNTAEDRGGGLYNQASNPTVKNTILTDNSPDDCDGSVTSDGYNLESGTSCGCDDPTDQQNIDPLLAPLGDNGGPTLTRGLLPGSPAIDAIPSPNDYNGAPPTDQRSVVRPQGARCDIGAFELEIMKGDVDGDGSWDLLDVVLCAQIARGLVTGTAAQRAAADVDDDGDVDADDVTILSEYVLGIRTTLP